MTRSMTAFARQSNEQAWGALVWEIRSVNHRYLDVFVKIPEELRSLEMQVREAVAKYLNRGKVEVALRYKANASLASGIVVNEELASALVKGCQVVNKQLHQPSAMNLMDVLRWPGVVEEPEHDLKPVLQATMDLLEKTLIELVKVRESEGQRMESMVQQRSQAMVEIVAKERSRRPQIIQAQREKILARLAELKAEPNMDRFEQELVYLTQKMDVDEELDRLDSHFQELVDIFKRDEAIGRRLDFIMQELNREANTLGSKSVDITTTQASVELKVLIEQMREQVQNIE
ncbi:MAG: YicC/YloC family endoribonuclease [Gammaproteobacteria bacterium]